MISENKSDEFIIISFKDYKINRKENTYIKIIKDLTIMTILKIITMLLIIIL